MTNRERAEDMAKRGAILDAGPVISYMANMFGAIEAEMAERAAKVCMDYAKEHEGDPDNSDYAPATAEELAGRIRALVSIQVTQKEDSCPETKDPKNATTTTPTGPTSTTDTPSKIGKVSPEASKATLEKRLAYDLEEARRESGESTQTVTFEDIAWLEKEAKKCRPGEGVLLGPKAALKLVALARAAQAPAVGFHLVACPKMKPGQWGLLPPGAVCSACGERHDAETTRPAGQKTKPLSTQLGELLNDCGIKQVTFTGWRAELEALEAKCRSLFDAIKHGDGEHQAWLKAAIEKHFSLRASDDVEGKKS